MTNELPFVLANRTSWRRLHGLTKLRSALHADKDFHPPPNLLPQPPRRTGERPTRSEDRRRRTEIRGERTSKGRSQNIGNTVSIIVYSFSVSFAVFFVPKSTCPRRRRPNQTSIKSSAIGFRPTDQPPQTRAEEE